MKSKLLTFLLIGFSTTGFAQLLTINQVVDNVLKNNFDVKLGKQDLNMASNNNTKGNAGLLPSVQFNTGANYSNNNTEIKFAGGIAPVNVDGAQNTSYNASIGANYTIFKGFANIKTFEKLQVLEDLSEQQLLLTLENAVITSIGLYLDLAKLQDDEKALAESLRFSKLRLNRIQMARELGSSTSLDLSNAQLDFHADSVSILAIRNQIGNVQRALNYLMGNEISSQLVASIDLSEIPLVLLDETLTLAKANNTALIMAELRKESALLDMDISKSNTMPLVNLNTSYGYTSAQNGAGIVLQQNNLGLSAGISVSIPIYNGGKIKTAMANAELNMAKSDLLKMQNALSVEKEVYDHWTNYRYQLQVEALETGNIALAQKNLDRSAESYKLGQITSLEYRQAQLTLLAAQNRLSAARYTARKEAFQLLRLQGKLIDNSL